jgi:hypothetical protein
MFIQALICFLALFSDNNLVSTISSVTQAGVVDHGGRYSVTFLARTILEGHILHK